MSIDGTPQPFRETWKGSTKIVIGIDIGPTQSGVAFSFLENGSRQEVWRVTRWPGQEAHEQQSRIPTLIWYDTSARASVKKAFVFKAVAFGAEALSYAVEEEAEDKGWVLAKNFKLHLHPSDVRAKHDLKLDALPPGASLRQVYSDFLGYLFKHTREFFKERIIDGRNIWQRYSPTMEVVIAHPNGWGIREQMFLRSAAVDARLATADKVSRKIKFVTEAESSVHFCIHHTNLEGALRPGTNFAVCDAGGSTVDTALYSVISTYPILKIEEKRASTCVQAGAIFVDYEVEKFLRRTLASAGLSPDDVEDYTKAGVKDFEILAKRAFKDESVDQWIMIAGSRFNNTAIGARRGRMTLAGSTVKGFFDGCVQEIIRSVDQQLDGLNVPHILLVGGFGDSPYLRQEFQKRYGPRGCQVTSTNDSSSKAVADGAVLWTIAQDLLGRILPFSLGIETSVTFDPDDPDHLQRKAMSSTSQWTTIPGRWKSLLKKGIRVDVEYKLSTIPFSLEFPPSSTELGEFRLSLYSHPGDDEPVWMRDKEGILLPEFLQIVVILIDLGDLRGALETHLGPGGTLQRRLDFDVCIRFGGEELEAYLEWEDEGITRIGPTTLIPSSD